MLTINECKEILNKGEKKYTEEEVKRLQKILEELVLIELIELQIKKNKSHE